MSRQNFYAARQRRRRREVDEELIVALVSQERRLQPRLGVRKLRVLVEAELKQAGVRVGRDRFFEVLREHELLLEPKRAEVPRTTQSYHGLPVFRNEIREVKIGRPNQVWVADLTYLRTEEGFLFLALVTDVFSRHIVGYDCGESLESIGCQRALEQGLKQLPEEAERPIHHSDRGTQYGCREYVELAVRAGLRMSMTEIDHCAENALAERMNGILKGEYGLDQRFKSKAQCRKAVDQAIYLYGTRRPHTALDNQFPAVVYAQELPPAPPLRDARRLGPHALRHEPRAKGLEGSAHVGATPVADHPAEPL